VPQRAAAQPKNTDQLTAEQKQEIAAIEARRGALAGDTGAPQAPPRKPRPAGPHGASDELLDAALPARADVSVRRVMLQVLAALLPGSPPTSG
jgi:hypothetical protein